MEEAQFGADEIEFFRAIDQNAGVEHIDDADQFRLECGVGFAPAQDGVDIGGGGDRLQIAPFSGSTPPNTAPCFVKTPKGLSRGILDFSGIFFARHHALDFLGESSVSANQDRQILSHFT